MRAQGPGCTGRRASGPLVVWSRGSTLRHGVCFCCLCRRTGPTWRSLGLASCDGTWWLAAGGKFCGPASSCQDGSFRWMPRLYVRIPAQGPVPLVSLPMPGRVLCLPREQHFSKGVKILVGETKFPEESDAPHAVSGEDFIAQASCAAAAGRRSFPDQRAAE